jgi:hypothetical protein
MRALSIKTVPIPPAERFEGKQSPSPAEIEEARIEVATLLSTLRDQGFMSLEREGLESYWLNDERGLNAATNKETQNHSRTW